MNNSIASCQTCGGTGRIRQTQGFFTLEKKCPTCRSDEIRQRDQQRTIARSGYVYILLMAAGILKIGHTQRHPRDRAAEWELPLLAYARSEDSADAEKRLHEHLSRYRKGAYELFEISFSEAVEALKTVVGETTILRKP
jgi:hypothetical protein